MTVSEVFLAMPKATRSQRLSAIERLNKLNVQVMTVPAPEEIVSGRFTVSDVRPIDVNDLLRRDPVEPLSDLIKEAVDGQTILDHRRRRLDRLGNLPPDRPGPPGQAGPARSQRVRALLDRAAAARAAARTATRATGRRSSRWSARC